MEMGLEQAAAGKLSCQWRQFRLELDAVAWSPDFQAASASASRMHLVQGAWVPGPTPQPPLFDCSQLAVQCRLPDLVPHLQHFALLVLQPSIEMQGSAAGLSSNGLQCCKPRALSVDDSRGQEGIGRINVNFPHPRALDSRGGGTPAQPRGVPLEPSGPARH